MLHRADGACRYLLLRSYRNWDFPKGQREPRESDLACACRETREETGLRDLQFPWGHVSRDTAPYGRGKVARYFVAISRSTDVTLGVNAALGRPEHHQYRWLAYAAARALLAPRLLPIIDWAHALTGC